MATLREVKSRISSVQNIKKITETMEKISTAKVKKNTNRLLSIRDYNKSLHSMIEDLVLFSKEEQFDEENPLLHVHSKTSKKKVLMLVCTSNKGLCGGYNNNVLTLAKELYRDLSLSSEFVNYIIGKKGIAALSYAGFSISKSFTHIDDSVSFSAMEEIAKEIISLYTAKEIDEVYLVYTKFHNSVRQKAVIDKLLPFSFSKKDKSKEENLDKYRSVYLSEPYMSTILDNILPLGIKMRLFYMVLEGNLSEQIARRVAMKQASDSASDIIKDLSLEYNRARQNKITNEIIEVIGAVKALEK